MSSREHLVSISSRFKASRSATSKGESLLGGRPQCGDVRGDRYATSRLAICRSRSAVPGVYRLTWRLPLAGLVAFGHLLHALLA